MNFTNVKSITIPNGKVAKISVGDKVRWQASALPSTFQQVEWIKAASEVEAYLDLGFAFDTGATVKIGMYYNGNISAAYLYGAAENSGKYRYMISAPYGGGSSASIYGSNGSAYLTNACALINGWNELVFTAKPGNLSVINTTNNSSNTMKTQVAYTMTNKLYLFAQNYNGTVRYGGARQISYFEYYDNNDNLICSLVPCYRKSDGEIGMYDIVRKIFLTSAGTGKFTKGADV